MRACGALPLPKTSMWSQHAPARRWSRTLPYWGITWLATSNMIIRVCCQGLKFCVVPNLPSRTSPCQSISTQPSCAGPYIIRTQSAAMSESMVRMKMIFCCYRLEYIQLVRGQCFGLLLWMLDANQCIFLHSRLLSIHGIRPLLEQQDVRGHRLEGWALAVFWLC